MTKWINCINCGRALTPNEVRRRERGVLSSFRDKHEYKHLAYLVMIFEKAFNVKPSYDHQACSRCWKKAIETYEEEILEEVEW